MSECRFSPEEIKGKIEDNVAKLATDTRLFERVGNTLIPTIDNDALVNSALQYKDDIKIPLYKDILSSNTRGLLQEISNQVYGRTANGDPSTFVLGKDTVGNAEEIGDANEKAAVEMFGQNLVDIATKVYPLSTSPSHGEVRSDINNQYGSEVITKSGGVYRIDIPQDVVNETLKEYNKQDYLPNSPQVNYGLKSAEILASQKAEMLFRTGDKGRWSLEKILTELQIPSAQKQLLISFGTRNRQELLTSLLANYTYTVEINTAKSPIVKDYGEGEYFVNDGFTYEKIYDRYGEGSIRYTKVEETDTTNNYIEPGKYINITEQEFNEAKKSAKIETPITNSQYYSNPTVPGGTNYTENEIRTPDITPSIKGHAQFSTNQGIGWFRSDDKGVNERQEANGRVNVYHNGILQTTTKNQEDADAFIKTHAEKRNRNISEYTQSKVTLPEYDATKTRRILEIQSDLFQKGRDIEELKKRNHISEEKIDDLRRESKNQREFEAKYKALSESLSAEIGAKNEFLQLLSKDNNWVTFFIKSIIQDSAKKGYEKVLFPTGDTAAKVEGHATLEGLKAQKEARLKILRQQIKSAQDVNPDLKLFANFGWEDTGTFKASEVIEKSNIEIAQIEQELKNIETSGFATLNSVANFYETTIKNILDKKGYKPERIKDEHGNEWYQVSVTPELAGQFLFGKPMTDEQRDILYDQKRLYEEAGIVEGDTPLQFMEKFDINQKQINKFLKANPQVNVEWGDEFSVFDPQANIISIALPELYEVSVKSGIPFQTVIGYFITHEMAHAAASYALTKGSNDEFVGKLLQQVRKVHETQPFEDQLRQGYIEEGLPYSMKNVDEFVSDAFGNPFFQEYLKQIPYEKENKTFWDEFIDWALSLLGIKRDSVYDKVVNYINSDKIQRDNLEGMLTPDYVDMQIYYRGNPKDYISARYEYFTSPRIKEEVEEIFKKLPESVAKLKALERVQNDPIQRGKIQSLLNAFNEVKGKENVIPVYVNMLIQAARIAKDIEEQMTEAGKMEDGMEKISLLNSLMTTAQNLQFITPLVTDILSVMDKEGYHNIPSITSFVSQLRGIISVEASLKRRFVKWVTPSITSYFSSLHPENETSITIRDQIDTVREKLESPTISAKDKKFYTDKLKKLESELLKMPLSEAFEKIFAGQYEDSSMMQAWLESTAINSHPLVASTFSLLRSMDIQTSQDMLSIENEHQKQYDKVKSLEKLPSRDPKITWKDITDTVEYVTDVNDDGKLVTDKTRMLNSSYQPAYLSEHFKFAALEDFYQKKMFESKRNNDEDGYDRYYELYAAQVKARQEFQKENSERRYKDEVYDMYALLDKQIPLPDGKFTSLRKERGDIFRELEELENKRNQATTFEDQKEIQDEIKAKNIELRDLKSIYTPGGEKKSGLPLALAEITAEYSDMRIKYGDNVLTPEGQGSFDREMASLKDQLDKGFLSKDQYDAALNDITTTKLEDEYFKKINEYSALIQEATDKITSIPELRPVIGQVNREAIKEGYKKIKEMTQAFRDNDGIIDGILFSRVRPELVTQIRDIQQELENLKTKAARLKGLSIDEQVELDSLTQKEMEGSLTADEAGRLSGLRGQKAERRDLYKRNKSLIDGYYDLIKGLSDLIDSSNSEYYLEEVDNQINKISNELKEQVRQEVTYNASLEDGTYFQRDGAWYKVTNRSQETGETEIKEVTDKTDYPAIDQIVDEIVKSRSEDLLKNSQWWSDNHYTYYGWDEKNRVYTPMEKPIYIWVRTLPKNKDYVKAGQPSWKFKTYQIKNEYVNPNHREIYPYVPVNKADKYVNDKYSQLQNSKSYLYNYLEFLRKDYHNFQEAYTPEKHRGDILPAVPLTEDEVRVQATKGLLLKETYKKLFNLSSKQDEVTAEDTKMILGKSQSKFFIERKVLPTRFTGLIPMDKQSADVPAMILAFILGARKYTNFSQIHPLLESLRTVTEDLPVQKVDNFGKKFSMRNLMTVVRGDANKVITDKHTDKSNLSKTIDFVLDTFMYGQTKNPSTSTIMGMEIDWQTASRDIKKLASFALFSLKPFIAIKNTLSNKVQAVINTNIGKGFYTNTDLAKGQWQAKNYVGNFIRDYRKFGDKSFIGQALEYFQVLHGTTFNAYGRRTQWTELKNSLEYLSIMKNISEFEVQITQFLAMANANKIKLNGKIVPLLEGFELDKSRNFSMKQGVTTTDDKAIDKKWVDSFIMRVSWVNRNINGAYRQDEKNMVQKTVLGDLAFYLNGYVFPGLYNRYWPTRYSIESQQITKGYWRQAIGFMIDLAKYRRGISAQWKDLRVEEKARIARFGKELGFITALFLLGIAMGGGDDKKKLTQNSDFYNYMLALAMTVKSETETFFPAPYAGLNELSRKINSPFAALRQISLIIQTMDNATRYVVGDSSAFYKKTGIHDGFHDKGDAKVVANFFKLIGWSGYEFDPLQRVGVVKRATQFR